MAESIINSGINYLMDKSGIQQHLDENEILRAAADNNQISNELYNKMGGFNFKENVPYAGNVGTGIGSAAYNIVQSIRDGQPISEIPGDVYRNYMGAAAGLTKEEKDIYDNILGRREPTLTDSLVNIPSNLKNMIGDAIFTKAYAPEVTDKERQSIEMGIRNPELTRKFDKSPAPLGRLDRIKEGVGSIFDKVRSVSPTGIISNLLSNLDRFDDLSLADQDFITSQGLGQDKYGYNKRSAFGNYANLVRERAKIAKDRRDKGLAQRAIDKYYEDLEKERQARLQRQIQQSIDRESGPDSYQSQAAAHESKVGRDSGERMGRV